MSVVVEETSNPGAGPEAVGKLLAQARDKCGFTTSEVAQSLRLTVHQVEALEAGNLDRLPGAVYARGFMRNYARLVKLDPVELARHYGDSVAHARLPGRDLNYSVHVPFPDHRWRARAYWLCAAVFAAGILGYGYYAYWSDDLGRSVRGVETPIVESAVPGVAPVSSPSVTAQLDAAALEVASQPASAAGAEQLPPRPDVAATAAHREDTLTMKFERDAWVEIRDRDGHRIFSQLSPAGSEQSVKGVPPFSLVVGNAAGVRLKHNDRPVDLHPHIKIEVARLTLE